MCKTHRCVQATKFRISPKTYAQTDNESIFMSLHAAKIPKEKEPKTSLARNVYATIQFNIILPFNVLEFKKYSQK